MKIEVTAEQAKIILSALRARKVVISNSNAPAQRKTQLKSELDALRNIIAVNLMKNGFITQSDFANGNY